MPRERSPTLKVLAAAVEVLRKELEETRRRCKGCPHAQRPIGFVVEAVGGSVENVCPAQDEDMDEAAERWRASARRV